ncbi:MAG: amidohydrolase family protein [Acidobacteriaceae bacterium]|nr:amidohydrolase family protein [Acidobacteriaceae bacterium]MBV8570975.1 amidohydrolase family protein [Acidobacteriaceae bacterium]
MAHTPWGDLPIADAHVHFFSHRFYAGLAQAKHLAGTAELGALLNWEIPGSDPRELAARWAAEMTRHGIRRVSLIASAHGDEGSVAAAVGAQPDRFFGYFMLDPTQQDAMERVRSAGMNANLHAVCLFPAMHKFQLTDERLLPIFQLASDHELLVFVHCGALSVGVRRKLALPCDYDLRFSNPLDVHALALRFPRLRFVLPHFGAGLFREALMVADLCPNVYLDTSSSNRWMLYEGLNVRTVFSRAIELLGTERLLFGSDSSFFPRGWQGTILEQQATALYELGFDEAKAAQIFGGNLERILAPRVNLMRGSTLPEAQRGTVK